MRHILSILLQNESGALARVASMFASRGFNIESLSVAPTDDETVSRLTLVTTGDDAVINQITKQLAKLIDVVAIADRTSVSHIARELGLIKLRVEPSAQATVNRLIEKYGARVLDDEPNHLTLEVTGTEQDLDGFIAALPSGVELLTVARSGPVVVARGAEQLSAEWVAGC